MKNWQFVFQCALDVVQIILLCIVCICVVAFIVVATLFTQFDSLPSCALFLFGPFLNLDVVKHCSATFDPLLKWTI